MLGERLCTDSVDLQQNGTGQIGYYRIAIIPRLNFTCNGRITIIRARVRRYEYRYRASFFQVWRPSLNSSTTYNKIDEVQFSNDQVIGSDDFRTVNITLTGNNTIEVQSGDVVGYYRQFFSRYQLRTVQTDGYVLYEFEGLNAATSINLRDADHERNKRQPLIEFTIGKCVISHCCNND